MDTLHVDLLSQIITVTCRQYPSATSSSPIDNAGSRFLARASLVSKTWRDAALRVAESQSWLELTGSDPVNRNPLWSTRSSAVLRGISNLFRNVNTLDLYSFVEDARDRGREGRGDYLFPGAEGSEDEDEGVVAHMMVALWGPEDERRKSLAGNLGAVSEEGDDTEERIGLADGGLGSLLEANGESLTSLSFEACHSSAFTNTALYHVGQFCPNLTSLTLRSLEPPLEITDDGMAYLTLGCPKIDTFREEQNWPLTDYAFVKIGQHWSILRELSLWRAHKITALGFTAVLNGCPGLVSLKLQNVRANLLYICTGAGIDDVAVHDFPNLAHLELSGSAQLARPLTALLQKCTNLEVFESFTFRVKGGISPWLSHAWRVMALRELMEDLKVRRPNLKIRFSDQLKVEVERRADAPLLLEWR